MQINLKDEIKFTSHDDSMKYCFPKAHQASKQLNTRDNKQILTKQKPTTQTICSKLVKQFTSPRLFN